MISSESNRVLNANTRSMASPPAVDNHCVTESSAWVSASGLPPPLDCVTDFDDVTGSCIRSGAQKISLARAVSKDTPAPTTARKFSNRVTISNTLAHAWTPPRLDSLAASSRSVLRASLL